MVLSFFLSQIVFVNLFLQRPCAHVFNANEIGADVNEIQHQWNQTFG